MITFEDSYRRYANDIYRFALALSGNPAEAEDLTSETFVRAWACSGKLRAPTLKSYLLTITRNLFLNGRRHSRRYAEDGSEQIEAVVDQGPRPDNQAEVRQELSAVLALLQRLPEIDRAVLALRVDAGLAYTEIGQALGISVSAAKVKVHRARLQLRRIRERSTP